MKKLLLLILVLGITDIANASVKLKGTVKNAPNAKLTIKSVTSEVVFKQINLLESQLDSNGNFSVEFTTNKPQVLVLLIKEQQTEIFIKDGYDLTLNTDYNDFDNSLKYIGIGEYDNNFMAADVKEMFYDKAAASLGIDEVEIFKARIDSLELRSNYLFSSYDKNKFSKEFLNYIIPTLKYRFIDVRWSYCMYMDSKTYKYVNRELPSDYMSFIDKIDINDQEAAGNGRYKVALMRYFYEKLEKDYYKNLTTAITIEERGKIGTLHCYNERKKLLKDKVLDFELSSFLRYNIRQINNSNQNFYDSLITDYLKTTKNTEYQNDLISHFNTINIASKKYLPKDLTLVNDKGKEVQFKDLEGKVLYIDFWATWCAPCLANMNDSKKLQENFMNNDNVLFIYINVKDSKKSWQKYLDKNKPDGIHLYADEEVSEKLYKELYINGIPRYVIVGKDGKLIESVAYPPIFVKESLTKAINSK